MAVLQAFLDMIEGVDVSILLFVQENLRYPILVPIMKGITHMGDFGIFGIILTLVLLLFPKTRKVGAMCFVSLLLTYLITNVWLKESVGRIRPYELYESIVCLVGPATDASFPSGHTSSSFATALICLRALKPRVAGVLVTLLAALIALSRIFVGIHYPSDVVAGFLVALVVSSIVLILFDRMEPGKGRRKR